uniref:Uncharacterized protein n=1 Tax=Spongospora subterranea TaxID=70186 RepID=A0A0H5R5E8_9EUKA|eukprot:CRZ09101.1 hypothetical protein [Spongospora subterranea]
MGKVVVIAVIAAAAVAAILSGVGVCMFMSGGTSSGAEFSMKKIFIASEGQASKVQLEHEAISKITLVNNDVNNAELGLDAAVKSCYRQQFWAFIAVAKQEETFLSIMTDDNVSEDDKAAVKKAYEEFNAQKAAKRADDLAASIKIKEEKAAEQQKNDKKALDKNPKAYCKQQKFKLTQDAKLFEHQVKFFTAQQKFDQERNERMLKEAEEKKAKVQEQLAEIAKMMKEFESNDANTEKKEAEKTKQDSEGQNSESNVPEKQPEIPATQPEIPAAQPETPATQPENAAAEPEVLNNIPVIEGDGTDSSSTQ